MTIIHDALTSLQKDLSHIGPHHTGIPTTTGRSPAPPVLTIPPSGHGTGACHCTKTPTLLSCKWHLVANIRDFLNFDHLSEPPIADVLWLRKRDWLARRRCALYWIASLYDWSLKMIIVSFSMLDQCLTLGIMDGYNTSTLICTVPDEQVNTVESRIKLF